VYNAITMQKDFKALAAVLAPDIPPEKLDGVVKPMEGLEAQFRPLVARIPLETEPSYVQAVHPEPSK